ALPVIRTEDALTSSTAVLGSTAGSSASGASSSASSSSGNSDESSTSARTCAIQARALSGVSWVTTDTIRDCFSTLVIPGTPTEETEKAISEIKTAAMAVFPIAPKNLSIVRMVGWLICSRNRRPIICPNHIPNQMSTAVTATMATIRTTPDGTSATITDINTKTPSTPAIAAMMVPIETQKPRRKPLTIKTSNTNTSAQSSQETPIMSHRPIQPFFGVVTAF